MKYKILKRIAKEPSMIVEYLNSFGYLKWIPDDVYLKFIYKKRFGKSLDLNNPRTFSGKLQWLKINDRNPLYTKLVDKFEVKNYINEKIGKEYTIPTIGVWDNLDDIDWDSLPNQFVMKCTHDSGGVVICKDKSEFDIEQAKVKLNKSLKRNYYYAGREWPYKNVPPRIIAEKYISDENDNLTDYKLMVFNGKVKCVQVESDRKLDGSVKFNYFDVNWNPMPFKRANHAMNESKIEEPINFDTMIQYAEKLAGNIPFVRVDFYEVSGHIYFGELTFYPGSGMEAYEPYSYEQKLGSWLDLKRVSN